jgi:hypothetical protein
MAGYKQIEPRWQPGESGNPDGRPKGVPNTKTRLQRLLLLTQNMTNPVTGEKEGFTVAEQMDLAQIIAARKGDTRAYNAIIDRLEGRASQSVDMTTNGKDMPTPLLYALFNNDSNDQAIEVKEED